MGFLWDIDLQYINEVTRCIDFYVSKRKESEALKNNFSKLLEFVAAVLQIWTGETYVGVKKDVMVKNTFQMFFIALVDLIRCIDDDVHNSKLEKEFVKSVKYNGDIYRYIGSCSHRNHKKITPQYNDIFVSWSKNESSGYLISKLYGPVTHLHAKIPSDNFGIDLEGFQDLCDKNDIDCYVARGNEREVVFPTIEEFVQNVKTI